MNSKKVPTAAQINELARAAYTDMISAEDLRKVWKRLIEDASIGDRGAQNLVLLYAYKLGQAQRETEAPADGPAVMPRAEALRVLREAGYDVGDE